MAYLDVTTYKARTLAPASYVDEVDAQEAGWTLAQLTLWSSWLDSRLRKRYAAPFGSPVPEAVLVWLTDIVTERLYLKRGIDAADAQVARITELADKAREEVREAADAKDGLFDLPLKEDTTATGITKGAPLGYAEASPYTWSPLQREDADSDPSPV